MKNDYGVGEIYKNTIALLYTKLFFNRARLIRLPIYIRGKKFLKYSEGLTTGYNCRFEMFDIVNSENDNKLIIGRNCKMGDCVHIAAGENVNIGDDCLIASKVYISDISHGDYSGENEYSSPYLIPDDRPLYTKPVTIGNKVWIGENVCILSGVTIGSGSIIGANSVVTTDISDNSIFAGAPAKIIKRYNTGTQIWERVPNENQK